MTVYCRFKIIPDLKINIMENQENVRTGNESQSRNSEGEQTQHGGGAKGYDPEREQKEVKKEQEELQTPEPLKQDGDEASTPNEDNNRQKP